MAVALVRDAALVLSWKDVSQVRIRGVVTPRGCEEQGRISELRAPATEGTRGSAGSELEVKAWTVKVVSMTERYSADRPERTGLQAGCGVFAC